MNTYLYRFIVITGSLFLVLITSVTAQSFTVKINGNDVSVIPYFNFHYVAISSSSMEFMVELTSEDEISSIHVSPKRLNINTVVNNKTAMFILSARGYYVVNINESKKLFIFIDEPEVEDSNSINILSFGVDNTGNSNVTDQVQTIINAVAGSGQTLVFPEGLYMVNLLQIPSNVRIHLKKGALLKVPDNKNVRVGTLSPCLILIKDAENIKITGRGILDGNGTAHVAYFGRPAGNNRVLLIVNSQNIDIAGIIMQDAAGWNTHIVSSQFVNFENVKVLSNVSLQTTDGINPDCSQDITIKNGFGYNGDDNIAVKSSSIVKDNPIENSENILIKGNVFLTKKSSLKVGTETLSENIRNIVFEENDVIEADRAMSLYSHDGAVFENIIFLKNHVETCFPGIRQCWIDFEIKPREAGVSKLGDMRNILIKECVFYNYWSNGCRIRGYNINHRIQVTFENNRMNGNLLNSMEDMNITNNNGFEDITFNNTTLTTNVCLIDVTIYPNPTNSKFTIQDYPVFSCGNDIDVYIFDLHGKMVYRETLFSQSYPKTIDISNYKSGIYFVSLTFGGRYIITKLYKN